MEYSARDLEIVEFDEHVRRRPGMYFRVAFENPLFGTRLLEAIASNALHPPGLIGPPRHTALSTVEIVGDRNLVVTIRCPQDPEWYGDQRLGPAWLTLAAADAISEWSAVMIWPEALQMQLDLDPAYVGADFAFPTAFDELDPHWLPYCTEPPGPGSVQIRDLRHELREVTYL